MQSGRRNFDWSGGRGALTQEERLMVQQQQAILRTMTLNQNLASLPNQPQVSPFISNLPLLTSVGNILQAGQLPSLIASNNLLQASALFPTQSMIATPAVVPAPTMVPPPIAHSSNLLANSKSQNKFIDNSKSDFFSSRTTNKGGRRKISRFDQLEDIKRQDDRKWNPYDQIVESDRSSIRRQEEQRWSGRAEDRNNSGREQIKSSDDCVSREWHSYTENLKPLFNPWSDNEKSSEKSVKEEHSREWNRDRIERSREHDNRSWNSQSQDSLIESRDNTINFADNRRGRALENERFDVERKYRERSRELDEHRWTSKTSRFEENKWTERQKESEESRLYEPRDRVWSKETKDINSWTKETKEERQPLSSQSSRAEEVVRIKRLKGEEETGSFKKTKGSGESWFTNSRNSEADSWTNSRESEGNVWNSKSMGSKDMWSKTSNESRDTPWAARPTESEETSWKVKPKDTWSEKSKISEQELSSRRPLTTGDSTRSNLVDNRPRSEAERSQSKGDDYGSRAWDDKSKDAVEHNWHSRDKDSIDVRESSSRECQNRGWINDEKSVRSRDCNKDRQFWTSIRDSSENIPSQPPSNFLYPDPCKNALNDVWSRLSSKTIDDRPVGVETSRPEENLGHQEHREDCEDDWEGEDVSLGRNTNIEGSCLAIKVGYLDSQLEQLDHRMMQLNNISSGLLLREEEMPSVWENKRPSEVWPSQVDLSPVTDKTDLRLTLQKKAEAASVSISAKSDLGGWTDDMVLIYPFMRQTRLFASDISELKTLLSKRIHSLLTEETDIQPRFLGAGPVCKSWFMVHCADQQSVDWLITWKPTLVTKKGMNLCVRKAVDAVRITHIEIYLKGVKDNVKNIEDRIHAQNGHLETLMWRRARHTVIRSGIIVGYFVDNACLRLLQSHGWRLYYELSKVRAKVVEHKPIPRLVINKKRRN